MTEQHIKVDERHIAVDELPRLNLMSAVIAAKEGHLCSDVLRVLEGLRPRRWDQELERLFMDWGWRLLQRVIPARAELLPMRRPSREVMLYPAHDTR